MSHWIVLPVLLPGLMAAAIVLAARHHIVVQRTLSLAGTVMLLFIAAGLAWNAADGSVSVYLLGDWQAPFGIVLVADRLSTYMVLLAAILATLVLLHAIGGDWDQRGRHFHALYQFQLMGIMGAFLTGDIFNLFVFFEVLLIASYGLVIHSGGRVRLRAGVQYVLFNLLGSTLFLFALGTLYAETGTLNMADLAGRVADIDANGNASIRVASVLLLLVFAVKAALVPLHFWLPSAYANAPGPVAALFAIMTKVGAYAIIRVYTLVFPPDLAITEGLHSAWLLPLAMISLAIGFIGVLAARRLDRLVAFSVIGSMGMVMIAIALLNADGLTAALYYIAHSTFATAALFLLVDVFENRRGDEGARIEAARPIAGSAFIAGLFFLAAIAMTGLPPLSGFVGKLLILDASFDSPLAPWVWATVLATSLFAVIGFARAGSTIFWKSCQIEMTTEDESEQKKAEAETHDEGGPPPILPVIATGSFVALLALMTVFAGPMTNYLRATTMQLLEPDAYISTVLGKPGKEIKKYPEGAH